MGKRQEAAAKWKTKITDQAYSIGRGRQTGTRICVILIFGIFFAFLLRQFSKVFIYYDDFGYLSLSYGYRVEEVAGSDYHLAQALRYMGQHYFYTSGRMLYLLIYQLLFMLGGLRLVQGAMAAVVLLVVVLSYALAQKSWKEGCSGQPMPGWVRILTAVFLCLWYGFIGVNIQRHGTYWFAAAFLYVMPALAVIGMAWMYYATIWEKKSAGWWGVCMLLAFLGAFSQEQWLVAVVVMVFAVFFWKWRLHGRKGISLLDVGMQAAAIAGALPILTSPAVQARLADNEEFARLSLMERVLHNIDAVTRLFFSPLNQNYVYLFLGMLMVMAAVLFSKKRGSRMAHILFIGASAAAFGYVFVQVKVLYHGDAAAYSEAAVWLLFGYILWMSAEILFYLFTGGRFLQTVLYLGAFFSMACLVIVPELPERVLLPFMLLNCSLLGVIFGEASAGKKRRAMGLLFCLCMAWVSISNLKSIYRGYEANWQVLQYDDRRIKEAVRRIGEGEKIKEIHLYRLVDQLCGTEMVYDSGFGYMIYWMRQYYELPDDVELVYDVVADMHDLQEP